MPSRAGPAAAAHRLALCLLVARATGKVILDGVYNDVKNPEGFQAECVQGAEMGFDGKTLIHPSQIEPANGCWPRARGRSSTPARSSPPSTEAIAAGKGVVTVDGRMIENLHVDNAERVLATADAIAALDQA